MKVALIHDALNVYGGAEKVLEELHATFPDAPIYAPIYDPRAFPQRPREWSVSTTWMSRIPLASKLHRALFPIYPFAMQSIDLEDFDVVISSSFNFAHHVVTGPYTRHICYCHSPARFLWDFNRYAEYEGFSPIKRGLVAPFLTPLRALDRASAQGVDTWIATSRLVQARIQKFYRRDSIVIAPPVDVEHFHISEQHEGYFLLLMRLVGWKRADIVIDACNTLGLPLVVAGDGRDSERLKEKAGPTIRFVGRVDGKDKADLYANCSAFILPAVEDFGITPLEAMASGRPVIAFGKGGVLDTVIPGVTGEFFHEQTAGALAAVLSGFNPNRYDPYRIRKHAENYDKRHFRRSILELAGEPLAASPRPLSYSADRSRTLQVVQPG